MTKRLQSIGNSAGLTDGKPVFESRNTAAELDPELSTEDERLIIAPVATADDRGQRLALAQKRVLDGHAVTFRKLAK